MWFAASRIRTRQDGRQGRFGWLLLISAVNLMLWSGVIALIARVPRSRET